MARSRVQKADAQAISRRLKDFALRRYGSWEAFYKKLDISRTTADAWRGKNPSVPDPPFLLLLARKANLDLDWLLLGQGNELWQPPDRAPAQAVEDAIEAELRNSEDATYEEFGGAWDRLKYRGDFSRPENVVLELAVGGVRPRFQESVRLVRHYAGVMAVVNAFVPYTLSLGPDGKQTPEGVERAERFRHELRKALNNVSETGARDPERKPSR